MVIPEDMKVKPSIYAYRCHVIANADVYDSNVTTMERDIQRTETELKFIPRNRVHPTYEYRGPSKRLILGSPTKTKKLR